MRTPDSLFLLTLAAPLAANPVVLSFVNEIHPRGTPGGAIELAVQPKLWSEDLHGWRVQTSRSECTLALYLDSSPVLVDLYALAEREYVWGTLDLDPDSDFVAVLDEQGWVASLVRYPCAPSCTGAVRPPDSGSICCWNEEGDPDWVSWYVDSFGSLNWPNGNYSSVSGTVVAPGDTIQDYSVMVTGPNGRSAVTYHTRATYRVGGLSAGRYWVEARGWCGQGVKYGHWPDSIELGYDDSLPGINIELLPPGAVEEQVQPATRKPSVPALLSQAVPQSELLADPNLSLFDASGRRIPSPKSGILFLRTATTARKVLVAE